jgi:hypothetical protein
MIDALFAIAAIAMAFSAGVMFAAAWHSLHQSDRYDR